ncbi:MAG TPA: SemiSWEET transporter [Xanthomonadaceae bacterium]|nr:SemiSWEET transporter [Xanthomonadaceae bacterium]
MTTDWIGYVAATLTTASFVPQAVRTVRTRDTRGISLWMYLLFTAGVACWLAYGIALDAWPIVVANAVTCALALVILLMKLRYG